MHNGHKSDSCDRSVTLDQAFGNERMLVLPQGNHLLSLMTILRDANTNSTLFVETTERVGDQLIAAGKPSHSHSKRNATGSLTHKSTQLLTLYQPRAQMLSVPRALHMREFGTRPLYVAWAYSEQGRVWKMLCAADIRMATPPCLIDHGWLAGSGPLSFGKILIQRDEETCLPTLFYSKFPPNVASQSTLFSKLFWLGRFIEYLDQLTMKLVIRGHNTWAYAGNRRFCMRRNRCVDRKRGSRRKHHIRQYSSITSRGQESFQSVSWNTPCYCCCRWGSDPE